MSAGTFFLPGPTEVHESVLAAMTQPMLPHRGAAFTTVYERVVDAFSRFAEAG